MGQEQLKQEIEELERKLEDMKATMPAHESSGAHAMEVLALEDELDEKAKALHNNSRGGEINSTDQHEKHEPHA